MQPPENTSVKRVFLYIFTDNGESIEISRQGRISLKQGFEGKLKISRIAGRGAVVISHLEAKLQQDGDCATIEAEWYGVELNRDELVSLLEDAFNEREIPRIIKAKQVDDSFYEQWQYSIENGWVQY